MTWLDTMPPGACVAGPLYLVAAATPDPLMQTHAGRRIVVMGAAEFAQLDPSASSASEAPGVVALEDTELAKAPLNLLGQCRDLLSNGGLLAILRSPQPVTDTSDAWHRFSTALAGHFGFSVVPVPNADSSTSGPLWLRRTGSTPRWRLAAPDPLTVPDWAELFARAFGAAISPELWRWKYDRDRGRCIAARRGERLVGYYGCTGRDVWFRGRSVRASQVCDVMVDPAERAVMTKSGVFLQLASTFYELFFGYRNEFTLAYGFPTRRHMALAERLGLNDEVDKLVELSWPPLPARARWSLVDRSTRLDTRFDEIAGNLWLEMRGDLAEGIVVVRDPDYLRYRYLQHPERRYEFLTVRNRLTGRVRGIAVLRRDEDDCKLMDIVAPLSAIPVLLEQARCQVAEWGLAGLTAWISSRYAPLFEGAGGTSKPLDVSVATNVWTPGPSAAELRNRWWLMMGDTDFS